MFPAYTLPSPLLPETNLSRNGVWGMNRRSHEDLSFLTELTLQLFVFILQLFVFIPQLLFFILQLLFFIPQLLFFILQLLIFILQLFHNTCIRKYRQERREQKRTEEKNSKVHLFWMILDASLSTVSMTCRASSLCCLITYNNITMNSIQAKLQPSKARRSTLAHGATDQWHGGIGFANYIESKII